VQLTIRIVTVPTRQGILRLDERFSLLERNEQQFVNNVGEIQALRGTQGHSARRSWILATGRSSGTADFS